MYRGAAAEQDHGHRLRDRRTARSDSAAAGTHVGGRGSARPAGRGAGPAQGQRGSGCPARWYARCARGQGGRDRCRRCWTECGGHRAGDAGRSAAARPGHRTPSHDGCDLPGPHADRRLQSVRDRTMCAGCRHGHRRGPDPRRESSEADQQRVGVPDEARLGARGHLHRPGRLFRGLPADHSRGPDL